ncbi:Protein CAP22 like protein [Verticillium longisporum]|uniref:Protein CAP22 like protein n=1 Tax=Verticillium longisporum TaxID=100787 RepID=A0A8I2Z361_VERLO|nr:Protein CAP22 like protein [Verticillium longisporum]KAG7126752.1 Protein CAP22 like protein [Verticillium longisporum]
MYFNRFAIAAASMATVALVNADLELDRDDYPAQCQNVCDPVARLGQLCNFDDNDRLDDRTEDQLEAQCFCTNNSFNVAQVAAQCAACMHNANRDTDDNEDINDIMFTCGFSSTSYDANAISTATGISVQATALTASSQLTTSLTAGATPTNTNSQSTPTGSSNNNNNGNNDDNSNNNNNNGNSNSDSQSTNEPSAANAIAPGFGTSALGISAYVAAAAVAGAMLLQ